VEQKPDTPAAEEKQSGGLSAFLVWPLAVLVVYMLCIGPFVMLVDKQIVSGKMEDALEFVYAPVEWAYDRTALHKPIGMYLHLWSKRFDAKGDEI
jgi:hypothetical protein